MARLLFIGMWNFADDAGRMTFSPKTIKAQVFPSDEISMDEVRRMIVELSSNGLLLVYDVEGKEFIQITGWHHQKIDKAKESKIPRPVVEQSTNDRRMVATDLILSEGKGVDPIPARDASAKRVGDFCQAVVRVYAECNSTILPETSRCTIWLSQGYDPEVCLAVIASVLARKPSISSLSYFDQPIADAHAKKVPPRKALVDGPIEIDWDAACKQWLTIKRWPKGYGNDPESPACRAPPEILRKHGIQPTGV
ncbi:MAG TPA: hypothetical protein VF447_14815 [Terriglobales bacterium]